MPDGALMLDEALSARVRRLAQQSGLSPAERVRDLVEERAFQLEEGTDDDSPPPLDDPGPSDPEEMVREGMAAHARGETVPVHEAFQDAVVYFERRAAEE